MRKRNQFLKEESTEISPGKKSHWRKVLKSQRNTPTQVSLNKIFPSLHASEKCACLNLLEVTLIKRDRPDTNTDVFNCIAAFAAAPASKFSQRRRYNFN